MPEKIRFIIDGKEIETEKGTTILNAARENGIYIPTFCYDDCVDVYGACGICVVEAEGVPKLLRSCATIASDGMKINTRSDRVIRSRKIALELIMSNHTGDCKAPCSLACPAGTDCQGYVGLIADGQYDEAIKLIKERIPLPASIGRVCPHPCEKKCRRGLVDEPVAIAFMKSFAADKAFANGDGYIPETKADTGKNVSIIGGGPAGLSAAYFLREMGHGVTVYDMMPKMGGMLRYGIPQYRLPKEILDKETSLIEKMGAVFKNGIKIGKDITFDEIRSNSDAVLVAIGAWKSSGMRVPGEELDGILGGIDFLREVVLKNATSIGKRVAVCGGGNTAMDACRTAVRLGAEEVYVVYRRTRGEMPADDVEITEAEEEGVTFKFLTNPDEFIGENGHVKAVKLQKMKLGEPDASGRRAPVPIEGEFETLDVDTVIMAIGQKISAEGFESLEKTKRGNILADEAGFFTSVDGVFGAGDATNKGADIAVSAIGEARKAALSIDAYLSGRKYAYKKPFYSEIEKTAEDFKGKEKVPRVKMPTLSPDERRSNFNEIVKGYSDEDAQREGSRCLECGCRDVFE
ncbi:MAG: FAD-dependent oxidoreductase, partial [Clostridiales bacterium]|nr:FAD-dependent oxidoreductase [Clostridiales bacterium]